MKYHVHKRCLMWIEGQDQTNHSGSGHQGSQQVIVLTMHITYNLGRGLFHLQLLPISTRNTCKGTRRLMAQPFSNVQVTSPLIFLVNQSQEMQVFSFTKPWLFSYILEGLHLENNLTYLLGANRCCLRYNYSGQIMTIAQTCKTSYKLLLNKTFWREIPTGLPVFLDFWCFA